MASVSASELVYDSAVRPRPIVMLRSAWQRRELVLLLARREVAGRYRQALLGTAWTLISPLVYAGALWVVFSHLARFSSGSVPYVVYVLSGVVVLNFVTQSLLRVAGAVVSNAVVLRRTFVPVGVFAAGSALAAMVPLTLMTATLLVVQLVTGAGIPLTAITLPVVFALLALALAGAGLAIGALGSLFVDAIELTRVALTLLGFLTPVFYPLSIVPGRFRWVVEANPVYHFVRMFRALAYEGHAPPWPTIVVCFGTAILAFAAGLAVFSWIRRALPSVL